MRRRSHTIYSHRLITLQVYIHIIMVDLVIGMSDCHTITDVITCCSSKYIILKSLTINLTFSILNSDVRIDPQLNKHIFSKGVRSVPNRVRLRLSKRTLRKEGRHSGYQETSYVLVQLVRVENFHHLVNETVEE